MSFYLFAEHRGCPDSVLEGHCPAEFSSNLLEVLSMPIKTLISWFRCV